MDDAKQFNDRVLAYLTSEYWINKLIEYASNPLEDEELEEHYERVVKQTGETDDSRFYLDAKRDIGAAVERLYETVEKYADLARQRKDQVNRQLKSSR